MSHNKINFHEVNFVWPNMIDQLIALAPDFHREFLFVYQKLSF